MEPGFPARAASPVLFERRRVRRNSADAFPARREPREWRAEGRCRFLSCRALAPTGCEPAGASRRAIAAFLFAGPCFRVPVYGRSVRRPRATPAGFRPPSPAPVQPLKAEPRSGPGRLPATSRVRGCEPRPQAPHPTPPSRRLMRAPLGGWNAIRTAYLGNKVKCADGLFSGRRPGQRPARRPGILPPTFTRPSQDRPCDRHRTAADCAVRNGFVRLRALVACKS